MESDELAFAGVARQAEMVRRAEVSSTELVELYLRRIERLDPELNAYRTVFAERVLADARQADARRGAGDDRPLLGVPIAVKDSEDVIGEPTGWGTAAHGGPTGADGELVSRLRAAGAVILGKTTLPELAIMGDTEGPAFGVTRNPWDTGRSPGGSSGGSGAAVAAGLCAAATASDGAGSIRIPASCCGLVGLKPQRDRIPLGREEHWHGLSVTGFVTRGVEDTALLLDTVAGRPTEPALGEAARSEPDRLRIALSFKPPPFPTGLDSEVRGSVEAVAERLRAQGHEVVEADPPYARVMDTVLALYLSGIAEEAQAMSRPERLQRRTRGFARMGRLIPAPLVERARRDVAAHTARLAEFFRDHDVLLTPTNSRPPVRAARWEGLSAPRTLAGMVATYPFTGVWNLTGQPAISIPGPPAADGLPIGAQLVAPADGEPRLVSLAAQLEPELGWLERRPPLGEQLP